ncbi:hypothetical protein D3C72_761720 [compost metagenome]
MVKGWVKARIYGGLQRCITGWMRMFDYVVLTEHKTLIHRGINYVVSATSHERGYRF